MRQPDAYGRIFAAHGTASKFLVWVYLGHYVAAESNTVSGRQFGRNPTVHTSLPRSFGLNRALVTTPWWPTNFKSFVHDPRFKSAAMFFLELKACVAQRTEPSGDHASRRKCDVEAQPSNGSVTTSDSCQSATFHIRTVLSSPALDRYCTQSSLGQIHNILSASTSCLPRTHFADGIPRDALDPSVVPRERLQRLRHDLAHGADAHVPDQNGVVDAAGRQHAVVGRPRHVRHIYTPSSSSVSITTYYPLATERCDSPIVCLSSVEQRTQFCLLGLALEPKGTGAGAPACSS